MLLTWKLNDDGTISVPAIVDGAGDEAIEVVLRRPTVGEYWRLKERLELITDERAEESWRIQDEVAVWNEKVDERGQLTREAILAIRKLNREFNTKIQSGAASWVVDVIKLLGGAVVELESLPSEMVSLDTAALWTRHWETRPTPPGVL